MPKSRIQLILSILLTLSLIPALILAVQRVQFERAYDTLAMVIDYPDVVRQARENGLEPNVLLARYKALGVAGVSIYEATLGRLIQTDRVLYRAGADWRNERVSGGKDVTGLRSNEYYMRSLEPGAAEAFKAKYRYTTREVTVDGSKWIAFPIDVIGLPAGPDLKQIASLEKQGFFVVYRPFNALPVVDPGADFPKVPFIIYAGDEVVGAGDDANVEKVQQRTQNLITGVVEAADQKDIEKIAKKNPVVRVFSLRPEWQAVLQPEEVASKFVLAARERNHRMLYVRPFYRIADTEIFLKKITEGLEKASLKLGTPAPLEFSQNKLLQRLSLLGPLLALALFVTCLPWGWLSALTALGVLGLSFVGGGFGSSGEALLAACVFPVLGFALSRRQNAVGGGIDWLRATAISIMGAFFVSALGAGRNEVLALEPFRGVALTLALPPLLLALTMLPRQDIRKTIRDLWNQPVSLGTLALALVALGAIALVLLRRGNTPAVSVSATETKVRAALQDSLIRPRTKEILLHPMAILGLTQPWPVWFTNLLLLGGVIGQGSIIDTFAHYHTPMLISLLRTVNGIAFGAVIGAIVALIVWVARQFFEARPPRGEGSRA